MPFKVMQGDCLELLRNMKTDSVDFVFTSPPYEAARTYGIGFSLSGQEWVDWAAERFKECVRVCRGMVCWVVEGRTKDYQYSATPFLLIADLHRAGVNLRKPAAYYRRGIPGGGRPDWFRNDWEPVICGSKGKKLAWSDPLARGPKHCEKTGNKTMRRRENGAREMRPYKIPEIANPGNVIKCESGSSCGGSRLRHENEAPFPDSLADFFVSSLCPPGGVVLDPFCGSGTTLAVAEKLGRNSIGIDIRQSQIELTQRRIAEVRSQ